MNIKTIDDINLKGKKVLVRVDFNVPLDENQNITNDIRMKRALPTIEKILDEGGIAILMSHLGRPKGKKDSKLSLLPVSKRLGELLNREVKFLDECIGPEVENAVNKAEKGDVILLENLRFYKEEKENDKDFAKKLASLADVYINDAFGAAHRAHASTEGITKFVNDKAFGYLMKKELEYFAKIQEKPEKPLTAILGGAKISGKIELIENLLKKVDYMLIGGGMLGTFYKAMGKEIGDSLVEEDKIEIAKSILESDAYKSDKLVLPEDVMIADKLENNANRKIVSVDNIEKGWKIVDIGPEAIDKFGEIILVSKTVFWNGPMGVFELENFENGTRQIAIYMVDATKKGAVTVAGGGDTATAIAKFGLELGFKHISTGGGASLELMEGKELPGVAAIK